MAPVPIVVDAHILFLRTQWPASRDATDPITEFVRVNGVAKLHQRLESPCLFLRQAIEIRQITCLIDLINVSLLLGEVQLLNNLVSRTLQQVFIH